MHNDRNNCEKSIGDPRQRVEQGSAPIAGGGLFDLLQHRSATLALNPGASVTMSAGGAPDVCVLGSGMMMMDVRIGPAFRAINALLYGGDLSCSLFAVSNRGSKLSALQPCRYLRFSLSEFESLISKDPSLLSLYTRATSRQFARQSLHATCLSLATCEQKVATMLVDFALNIGRDVNGRVQIDLPFSRRDIADYLALNADTVSRTMSGFKADGLVTSVGRRRMFIADPERLAARSPLSSAAVALSSDSPCAPCFAAKALG